MPTMYMSHVEVTKQFHLSIAVPFVLLSVTVYFFYWLGVAKTPCLELFVVVFLSCMFLVFSLNLHRLV